MKYVEYNSLPEYLFFDKSKGVYRFILITGKKKSLGSRRELAIAIAREYNLQMRPKNLIFVDSLIQESGGKNGEAKPFAIYVEKIMNRVIYSINLKLHFSASGSYR